MARPAHRRAATLASLILSAAVGMSLGAARAEGTEPAAPDRASARALERAAWLGRSCAAPGCAGAEPRPLAQGAAFAGAVLAVAGLARRRAEEAPESRRRPPARARTRR